MASSSSEVDVDSSILEQVKKAISRVAAIERDSEGSSADCDIQPRQNNQTISELLDKHQHKLEDQVASLESEIKSLEEQIAGQGGSRPVDDAELESAILSLVGDAAEEGRSIDVHGGDNLLARLTEAIGMEEDKKMQSLKSQIKLNEAFSGVKFKSVEWEIKHKDDTVLLREHTHVGTTLEYDFKVVFVVSEEKSENCGPEFNSDLARIVDFKAEVDPRARVDMESFLNRMSLDFDLIAFYQTYTKYCHLHKERTDTFNIAKSRFKDHINFAEGPEGSRLRLSNHKGIKLNFTWKLAVSLQGTVECSIGLQVKTPSNASSEVIETLSRVPKLLDKMILAYGHREGFLQLLTLFEED